MADQERRHIPQTRDNRARAKCALESIAGNDVFYPAVYRPPSEIVATLGLESRPGMLASFDKTWSLPRVGDLKSVVVKLDNGRTVVYPADLEEGIELRLQEKPGRSIAVERKRVI